MFYRDFVLSRPGERRQKSVAGLAFSRYIGLAIVLCLMSVEGFAETQPRQRLSEIQDQARQFLLADYDDAAYPVEIEISRLDRRLRLKACDQPLEAEYSGRPERYGRMLVKVYCAEPKWQVYVQTHVRGMVDVLVTTRAIPRGTVIGGDSIRVERHSTDRLNYGFFSEPGAVEGMEARQSIRPGTVLSPRQLAPPRLVRRGESVQLLVRTGSFSIRMKGQALDDADQGKTLRVRNSSSGRVVEGRAIAPGLVEVSH